MQVQFQINAGPQTCQSQCRLPSLPLSIGDVHSTERSTEVD